MSYLINYYDLLCILLYFAWQSYILMTAYFLLALSILWKLHSNLMIKIVIAHYVLLISSLYCLHLSYFYSPNKNHSIFGVDYELLLKKSSLFILFIITVIMLQPVVRYLLSGKSIKIRISRLPFAMYYAFVLGVLLVDAVSMKFYKVAQGYFSKLIPLQ